VDYNKAFVIMDHGFQVCLLEQFQVNEEVIGEEDCEEEEELHLYLSDDSDDETQRKTGQWL
jgi:hypothetical protein